MTWLLLAPAPFAIVAAGRLIMRLDAGDRFSERFIPCAADVAAVEATKPRMRGDHRYAVAPVLSIVDKLDAARVRLEVAA